MALANMADIVICSVHSSLEKLRKK